VQRRLHQPALEPVELQFHIGVLLCDLVAPVPRRFGLDGQVLSIALSVVLLSIDLVNTPV
jgi:hypothetical protein